MAKFYDRDTRLLKEYWEMSSTVPNLDLQSFNDLNSKRKIFADGHCYFLYENKKKKLIAKYEKGFKKRDFLGFYETGEPRFKGTYNKIPIGKFVHFYKDGSFKKEESFVNGINNGKTIFYDKTGKVSSEYNYLNGAKDGYSYLFYPNGNEKRKLKYKMDKLVSEKCLHSKKDGGKPSY